MKNIRNFIVRNSRAIFITAGLVLLVNSAIYETLQDETNFTAQEASDIAIEYLGGEGTVESVEKEYRIFGEEEYDVDVIVGATLYNIDVSMETGEVVAVYTLGI